MPLKHLALCAAACALHALLPAQTPDTPPTTPQPPPAWNTGATANIGFANTGFSTYWQAGAVPTLSLAARADLFADWKREKRSWDNSLTIAYGLVRQGGPALPTGAANPFLKSDDQLELASKYGHRLRKDIFLSALAHFRSQAAPGYASREAALADSGPVRNQYISKFLAPAAFNLNVGLDYKPSSHLTVQYSPANAKLTIVTDTALRTQYLPPAAASGPLRLEFGSALNALYRRQFQTGLLENCTFQSKLDLFANYLYHFGNIDVNWENLLTIKANKYLGLTLATRLLYDDDVRFDVSAEPGKNPGDTGPRTQFKHLTTAALTLALGQARAKK